MPRVATSADTIARENIWLRRLARAVREYCAAEDRDGVLQLDSVSFEQEGTTSIVGFGSMTRLSEVSLELWLQQLPSRTVLTNELGSGSISRELAAWFNTAFPSRAKRLAKAGGKFYGPAISYSRRVPSPEIYRRPALVSSKDADSGYGVHFNLTVPGPQHPPAELFVADLALFFLQTARIDAGLRPLKVRLDKYRRVPAPGTVLRTPGSGAIGSSFGCPMCGAALPSHAMGCVKCGWELHARSSIHDEPLYPSAVDDT